jgi:beta-phosphoglucomutase
MTSTKLKAVFFDMDGVLYDSMPHHAHSWTKALAAKGIPYSEADTYENEGRTSTGTIQLSYRRHLNREAMHEEVESIYQHKTKLVSELPQPAIMPGIQAFMALVKDEGLEVMVVTGSKQPSLLKRLENDFGILPSNVVSGKDVTHEKPHPEPYEKALAKCEVQPNEALVIENAPLGVLSAKGAKIFTVAVNTGPLDDSILANAGADMVLDGTHALVGKWDEIKQNFK